MLSWIAAAVLLAGVDPAVLWRGDGSGRYPDQDPPQCWGGPARLGILWTAKVGRSPFSSPLAAGGRVLVLSDPARLSCLDASTGAVLWTRTNGFSDLEPKLPERETRGGAGNTAASPVTDGRVVYAVFGSGIVSSHDLSGGRRWMRSFDAPPPQYGRSSSPLLAGGRLVVSLKCLQGLDLGTGEVLWKAEGVPETYGTPVGARIGGVDLIVTPNGRVVRGSDGAVLASGLGEMKYASPIVHDGVAFFIDETSRAFRISLTAADRVEARKLWEGDLTGEFFASPVLCDGALHAAANAGLYQVLDAATGRVLLEKELEIPSAGGRPGMPAAHIYPSLSLAGKRVYLGNDAGDLLVLSPGGEYQEIARNHLGKGSGGTPAFAGGRIYLRSGEDLHCIGR